MSRKYSRQGSNLCLRFRKPELYPVELREQKPNPNDSPTAARRKSVNQRPRDNRKTKRGTGRRDKICGDIIFTTLRFI